MRKQIRTMWLGGACGLFTLLLVGAQPTGEVRKGPLFLIIQGGGLESPVVIHRGEYPGRSGDPAQGGDPLQAVLNTLMTIDQQEPSSPDARYYEVGEVWLNKNAPARGPDGAPAEPLRMEHARVVSRIYPDEPDGPIWNYLGTQVIGSAIPNIIYGADGEIERVELTLSAAEQIQSGATFKRIVPRGVAMLEAYGLVFGR